MFVILVLLPYEITLFSNIRSATPVSVEVLLPYEITLFSNSLVPTSQTFEVLLPYEITLFSNNNCNINHKTASFTTL